MQRPAESAANRRLAVLVIDDEDYVADMIASTLHGEHYQVYVAYNGRDGLELSQREPIDLIIVDIMMPYFNGIDVLQTLQDSPDLAQLPVILMSAGARPRQEWPHVKFLIKPFLIEDLIDLVVAAIGQPAPVKRQGPELI